MLTRIAREKASPFEIMVLKEKRIAALREASGDSS
jgi:antitoxin component of RelBE/YafQ-DinJ toxin-antitoxin module